ASTSSSSGQGTCTGGPGGGAEVGQSGIVPLGLAPDGPGAPVASAGSRASAAGPAGEGDVSARRDGAGHSDGGAGGSNDGLMCGSVRGGSVRGGSVRGGSVRGGSVRGGSVRGGSVRGGSSRDGCGHGGCGPTTVRSLSSRSGAGAG